VFVEGESVCDAAVLVVRADLGFVFNRHLVVVHRDHHRPGLLALGGEGVHVQLGGCHHLALVEQHNVVRFTLRVLEHGVECTQLSQVLARADVCAHHGEEVLLHVHAPDHPALKLSVAHENLLGLGDLELLQHGFLLGFECLLVEHVGGAQGGLRALARVVIGVLLFGDAVRVVHVRVNVVGVLITLLELVLVVCGKGRVHVCIVH